MKKLSFAICVILIAFCIVFVSCKNDDPVIKFTYNEMTFGANGGGLGTNGGGFDVKEGDEAKIVIEYNASNKIKQIDYKFDEGEVEIVTKFDKSKSHKIEKTVKFEKIGTVCINTSIMDEKDGICDFILQVKVK